MGEFFRVIWEEDDKRDIFTFGGKLMESAYMDNKRFAMLVDHVAKIKKPVRIAVIGDSADKAFSYNTDSLSPSLLDELYRETWRRNYDGENDAAEPSPVHRFIFNLPLQESPSSKRSERWRGMEEKSSDVIRLQYKEMAG